MKKLINKLLLLFIAGILLGACSSEDTPSDGGGFGGEPFNNSSYPDTLTINPEKRLYIDKGTLKGFLPDDIISAKIPSGFDRSVYYGTNKKIDKDVNELIEFFIRESELSYWGEKYKHELFSGKSVEQKIDDPYKNANIFCLTYSLEKKDKVSTDKMVSTIYLQTSNSTFVKKGFNIYERTGKEENWGVASCDDLIM